MGVRPVVEVTTRNILWTQMPLVWAEGNGRREQPVYRDDLLLRGGQAEWKIQHMLHVGTAIYGHKNGTVSWLI
jgi:hypothetical protein